MEFKNIRVMNLDNALRGMRNPKESYSNIDSQFGLTGKYAMLNTVVKDWMHFLNYDINENVDFRRKKEEELTNWLSKNGVLYQEGQAQECAFIGPKDMKLAQQLIMGGSEHRKFLRQIFVTVDITAPLYWFKEFDTYKVGTTANSTSTMHKITSKPITLENFEIGDYCSDLEINGKCLSTFVDDFIAFLESLRLKYLETKDKKYWKELIRWLPEGWLQTRTVTMTYENLLSMCNQREGHKLIEWSAYGEEDYESFLSFAHNLPYANELIFTRRLFLNGSNIFPKIQL